MDEQVEPAAECRAGLREDAGDVVVRADVALGHQLRPTESANSRTLFSIRSPW